MKKIFYRFPILFTVIASFVLSLFACALPSAWGHYFFLWIHFFLILTGLLSLENLFFLFTKPDGGVRDKLLKKLEPLGLLFGGFWQWILLSPSNNITFTNWNEVIQSYEKHFPLAIEHLPTFVTIAAVALIGYSLLRFGKPEKMPPLVVVLSLSALYLGNALMILLFCQLDAFKIPLNYIYPINVLILSARIVLDTVLRLSADWESLSRFPRLAKLLSKTPYLPILSLILAFPLLGVLIAFLLLFGQQPDSILRLWTETADWTFSQMTPTPPPSVQADMHYLCTVAAGGHAKVVKPLRLGKRHGHTVIVNRQLCVANAFEDLLKERTPRLHKAVRNFYDRFGYPIAKHIRSRLAADVVYLLMKPFEWFFLLFLYLFDRKPENPIAVQYPHTPPPQIGKEESFRHTL